MPRVNVTLLYNNSTFSAWADTESDPKALVDVYVKQLSDANVPNLGPSSKYRLALVDRVGITNGSKLELLQVGEPLPGGIRLDPAGGSMPGGPGGIAAGGGPH